MDLLGVNQTTTSYYEIRGLQQGKCIFYIQTENISLTFPSGTSERVISQQQALYNSLEGRNGTCQFSTSDLAIMLNLWSMGNFSSDDFDKANCSGDYFSQQI